MIDACFAPVPEDYIKIFLSIASFSVALIAIFILKKFNLSNKSKISLIYLHLSSLFFPFTLMSTNLACGFLCLPCYENPLGLVILSLPTTLVSSAIAGFFVVPGYYMISRKSFLIKNNYLNSYFTSHAKKLNIRPPSFYIINIAKPLAFSFKTFTSAVFLSVGLLDILKKKETEAVILHELFHIKEKSSVLKFSAHLMKFSPFSIIRNFNAECEAEEKKADEFAIETQGTAKHLISAKRKIKEWDSGNHDQ